MLDYNEFYELLKKYGMITPIWKYELDLIKDELNVSDNEKDYYLILFSIYFSLINSGNVCMSLEENVLNKKWDNQINGAMTLATDETRYSADDISKATKDFSKIKNISKDAYKYLDKILMLGKNIIGNIFEKENDYLYLRKYNSARKKIKSAIEDLYLKSKSSNSLPYRNVEELCRDGFSLTDKQKEVVEKGFNNNLIVTGGPGTGKTTSILFLLIYLLSDSSKKYNIYLAAASGKASSRMKESILKGINDINDEFKEKHNTIIQKINGTLKDETGQDIEEFTIHRLLGIDHNTNGFKHNKDNQFPDDSIFIIDEASMIDICLFNNLLEAIPYKSRVFILGDKDQLPSVEVGAVFGDLVSSDKLEKFVVKLDESRRFDKNSDIYKLADEVNRDIDLTNVNFVNYIINDDKTSNFEIKGISNKERLDRKATITQEELDDLKKEKKKCPIYYYTNPPVSIPGKKDISQRNLIKNITLEWAKKFYCSVQNDCTNIDINDKDRLNYVFSYTEEAKVLCAENEGIRGVRTINSYIKNKVISKKEPTLSYQYPGQVMMINTNNKLLKLYNGDTGILVTINKPEDDTIYLMVKKENKSIQPNVYKKDDIFNMNGYLFYPLRLISLSEIDLAYAITVHKSQGSDYDNILVILPTGKGHPLLNRQILYTAITRTKGYTYILSNLDSLNVAKGNSIERDTNIFK